ncbi:MAG TPA: hypothetical protein VMS71_05870 [Candidatus Acidoferrum sp.]|nr:hypothetical protein [Candidatus Acidoferrum sp.]
MRRVPIYRGVLALPAILLVLGGCIKIQTGPVTPEQATENSNTKAKDYMVNWHNRLQGASSIEKMTIVTTFIDSVTSNYLRYGAMVAQEWRRGSATRDQAVADSEMRTQMDRWNKTQRPVIQAYESMVEYGVEQVTLTNVFDKRTLDLLNQERDFYYKTYSAVFFPVGTADDYDSRLQDLKGEWRRLSGDMSQAMLRYQ